MQTQVANKPAKQKKQDKASFSDPNFASNKVLPVHRWVPWIAGFSSNFVRGVIDNELSEKGTVLDPFAGVGTTLVEAAFKGHDVVGFEINPYAALACKVKLDAQKHSPNEIRIELEKLRAFYNKVKPNGYSPFSEPPTGFKTRKEFYSPIVLRKVLIVQDHIEKIEDKEIQEIFRLAFASTMVKYSNYSYEPSLGTRSAAGRADIDDFPVLDEIANKLDEIAEDVDWANENVLTASCNSRVLDKSFFECQNHIEAEYADLAITSPPYLNNYHYIRNTRPHLYWLGYAQEPKDTKPLEQQNFGKYWQTVRDMECVDLTFPNPPEDLIAQLQKLRTLNKEKGVYGGNGWANYAASYFNDCYRFALGLQHSLKPGAKAFVVIGNSILQGEMIPTDLYLGKIAEIAGLELVDIHVPRDTRVGNSIIQSAVRVTKANKKHNLYEAVVELRKRK